MTKVLVGILSLGLSLAAAGPAAGQEDGGEERVLREPDRVVIEKTTTVDFNDTEIDGELSKPEGSYLPGRERARFESLLQPRKDFLPELDASTEKEGM